MGDSQLSDDLAQDTFLKAYTSISSFKALASFQTWLMRIAYNVFYDYTRREKARVNSGQLPAGSQSLDSVTAANAPLSTQHASLKMDIYAALTLLKPDERTCITLQLIDGYDIRQIAGITGLKTGTVKSHLSRGKEKLANYLKKNGYERR